MINVCDSCKNASKEECVSCMFNPKDESCSFCKETTCPAYGEQYFEELDETLFVDFRFDAEFNQIDCQFGTLDENNMHKHAEWSNFAININYCPVCGRKLPPVE